jgi:hypothetical protein
MLNNGGINNKDPTVSHATPDGQSISWNSVKKMSARSIKEWFIGLSTIDYFGVMQVEAIIQRDQDITYERLLEVSNPSYRLLIVVAAMLQYANLSEGIKIEQRSMNALKKSLLRSEVFVGFLASPQISCQSILPFLPQQQLEKQ